MKVIYPLGKLPAAEHITCTSFFKLFQMSPYKSKDQRSQWTEENLQRALNAIANGQSKNSAAKEYHISRRTLNRYLAKGTNKKQQLGRKTILTADQESELVRRIIRLAEVGYPMTKGILRKCVYNFCEKNHLPHLFSQETRLAGRYWLKAFLRRHPDISPRRAQNMNPARAQKLNKAVVSDYFDKLKSVLLELDLMDKPERIYNVDEKGCRLMLHHQQSVLAKKGTKRVHLVAPEHAENVTIVSCGNAIGGRIPPAILFKGQRLKPEWCDNLPPGTLALMTPKASMTIDTFNTWIKHLAKYKLPGKCLLIFDGASCHLDTSIVDTAETHDITLFCLPSNTTHELQPMDKAVFKSFEHYWDEQVILYWTQHKNRSITKQRFGDIFSTVWDKAVTPQNISSGFSSTGIYPFNPQAIPEEAFAPSILTERPQLQDNQQQREVFPEPGPSGCQKKIFQISVETTPPSKIIQSHKSTKPRQKRPQKTDTWSSSSDSSEDEISLYSSDTLSKTFSSEEERAANKKTSAKVESTKSIMVKDAIQNTEIVKKQGNIMKESMEGKESEDGEISFTEMLETPYKDPVKTTNRRKAINSKALVVKKAVFKEKIVTKKTTSKNKTVKSKQNKEAWYCKLCREDVQKDMRLCSMCAVYVHEECVGLTKSDKLVFICPDCQ